MSPEKVADVLFRAADRVQFQGWTRGTYALAMDGRKVGATHPDAAAWCARGALKTEAPSPYWLRKALYALGDYLASVDECWDVMAWNDQPNRTAGEVADTMRRCAKELLEAAAA